MIDQEEELQCVDDIHLRGYHAGLDSSSPRVACYIEEMTDFFVTAATLRVHEDSNMEEADVTLRFDLGFNSDFDVPEISDVDPKAIRWSAEVTAHDRSSDCAPKTAIGTLEARNFGSSDSNYCIFTVAIGHRRFKALRDALVAGRKVETIEISVRALDSAATWGELKEKPSEVESFDVTLALYSAQPHDDE